MPIDGRTRVAFVLGHPVEHSLSPVMHQAAFRAVGLNAAYLPWSVPPARLTDAVRGLRAMENLLGVNVTVPHKQAVVPLVDGLTPEAEALGAVNTILLQDRALIGDNTDGAGFLTALRDDLGVAPTGLTAAVLGAGGAARAVAFSLARAGVGRLYLLNRTLARAVDLADRVRSCVPTCNVQARECPPAWRPDVIPEVGLLVNTTSLGLRVTDPSLIDEEGLPPSTAVVDLIYRPAETPLLAAARRRGCRAVNGLGMLLHQGALAFERWTGRPAPLDAMRTALERSA
jgi:shikimate dehydrogenase